MSLNRYLIVLYCALHTVFFFLFLHTFLRFRSGIISPTGLFWNSCDRLILPSLNIVCWNFLFLSLNCKLLPAREIKYWVSHTQSICIGTPISSKANGCLLFIPIYLEFFFLFTELYIGFLFPCEHVRKQHKYLKIWLETNLVLFSFH